MRHRLTAASAAFFMLALWPVTAAAQGRTPVQCNPRDDVVGHLAKKYQEAPVAIGVTNKGGLVEVLTTGDGGTWTIILSRSDGTSCMVAAGEGWRFVPRTDSRVDPRT